MIGRSLGPYRLVEKLGAGGMGEVYRARDTRLDRTVAIKVVADALARDPQLLERFEREARAISQLDHPNICALYDVGTDDGVSFLVMQYLEGQTLADRLATAGAVPLADALPLAVQIAAALDAAHHRGITHRDLKPANVMVTKSGARLLDFGLAKAAEPAAAGGATMLATTPPAITTEGQILGTFQYMAPEQLEGREADHRTDIFAFGALLYEMVTGRKAFDGKSQASLIAAIMSATPPAVSALQPSAPPALDRIVRKCLAKDPDERWQSARDLHDELVWLKDDTSLAHGVASSSVGSLAAIPVVPRRVGRERLAYGLAAAGLLASLVLLALGRTGYLQPDGPAPLVSSSSIVLPSEVSLGLIDASELLSVSPDGRMIVFAAGSDGARRLWLRRTDVLDIRPLAGSEGGGAPFWSPDSRSVGFKADGRLKRMDVSGGPVVGLAESTLQSTSAWGPDNTIVFAPKVGPLYRIPASGGELTPATTLEGDEVMHLHPSFLPDGRHFLYVARGLNAAAGTLYVASLDPREPRRRVGEISSNVQYASGHLLYLRQRTLMAQPFDPERAALAGEPVPIAEQLETGGGPTAGGGAFSVSQNGILVYRAGVLDLQSQLRWVDRSGKLVSTLGDPVDQMGVQLSSDERVAVSVLDVASNTRDVWIHDLARGIRSRFTFDPSDEMQTAWRGDELIFNSRRTGRLDLFRRPARGTGPESALFSDGQNNLYPTSVSPDGRFLLYFIGNASSPTGNDILVLPLEGDAKPMVVVRTPYNDAQGQFSPDGLWVAYQSNESGRVEIYVVSFPDTSAKWQVSNGGGSWPRWSADGREIFYVSDNRLFAVPFASRAQGVDIGSARTLFTADLRTSAFGGSNGYPYDVARDGRRFLINALPASQAGATFTLVVNWAAGLPGR